MCKMTYNQIFEKSAIIKNIPIMFEGRKLPKGMSAKVVMVRVQYDKHIDNFNKEMEEVVKGLKPEGFDERSQKFQKMNDIDNRKAAFENWKKGDLDAEGKPVEKPVMPSDEELKEADETRKGKEEFEKELLELNEEYASAQREKMSEEVEFSERLFTMEELSDLIEMLGEEEGTMKINDRDVPKQVFLNLIASRFTE